MNYTAALLSLMPHGLIWSRSPDGPLAKLMAGLAVEFQRIDDRARDLLTESNAATVDKLLSEWESDLGLSSAADQDIEARKIAVQQRNSMAINQSRDYYLGLIQAADATGTITEYNEAVFGGGFGEQYRGRDWVFTVDFHIEITASDSADAITQAIEDAIVSTMHAHKLPRLFFSYTSGENNWTYLPGLLNSYTTVGQIEPDQVLLTETEINASYNTSYDVGGIYAYGVDITGISEPVYFEMRNLGEDLYPILIIAADLTKVLSDPNSPEAQNAGGAAVSYVEGLSLVFVKGGAFDQLRYADDDLSTIRTGVAYDPQARSFYLHVFAESHVGLYSSQDETPNIQPVVEYGPISIEDQTASDRLPIAIATIIKEGIGLTPGDSARSELILDADAFMRPGGIPVGYQAASSINGLGTAPYSLPDADPDYSPY